MYENMTYEAILERMMARVLEQYPNLDSREGSIIFNALAPAAVELAIAYVELDNTRNESFVKTATREYILMGCTDMGINISMFNATAGKFKGVFNVEIDIGSRWNLDLYNYTVQEYLGLENGKHTYSLACETLGTSPNTTLGALTPINYYPTGLLTAEIIECIVEGENERTDEEIKEIYYEYVNSSVSDGNVAQYERWCAEYPGIGHYKIFPLWNGANTVKVSILSASNGTATDELIDEFQDYLDPKIEGMGNGVAPIGAFVTVTTATEVPLAIRANVKLKAGYQSTEAITEGVRDYLKSISYTKRQVSYLSVGAAILDVEGVESVNSLLINGSTNDIFLGVEEIPVLGETTWTVVS